MNRAAALPGRTHAAIKERLLPDAHPRLTASMFVNRNGLLATRYSQLDTQPSSAFQPGEIVVQHLGQPTRVAFVAAMHKGERRPLVVGVSGIDGSLNGKFTIDILQSLYDSGFHVVHLESLTSVNHQVRNQRLFLGGLPEGLLLYQTIAELRARPEFADSIEQVHLLGASYGGMLCGIAAHCEDRFQRGVIDGAVLALSPPLDLRTLFGNLEANAIVRGKVQDSYVVGGVKRFLQYVDFGLSRRELAELDFDTYMRRVAFPYFQKVKPAIAAEYPDLPPVNTPDDLYAVSSLRPHLATLGVPYFFLFAYDDPVVSPEDHFREALAGCPNPLVDGMLTFDGGHLGFDPALGYPYTSRVAIDYFRYWTANGLPK